MIATRLVLVMMTATTLFALGVLLGNAPLLVIALVLGGYAAAALSFDGPGPGRASLHIDRRHPRIGDTLEVQIRWEVTGPAGPVTIQAPLPDAFQLVEGRNIHTRWKRGGVERGTLRFRIRCGARGRFGIGPVMMHCNGPLAVRPVRTRTAAPMFELVVAPRVRGVQRVQHLRGRARLPLPAGDNARSGGKGSDFHELRDYQTGDALRIVNWKATARRSDPEHLSLTVNEYEPEGKKSVWLFLDGGAHMEIGRTNENSLDRAVEGALGLVEHFGRRGYRVGATVFHQPQTRVMYPDVGTRQTQRLVRVLASLVAHPGGEGLDAAVVRSRGFIMRERPLIILVTRPEADPAGTRLGIDRLRTLTGTGARAAPIMLLAPTPHGHIVASGHHPLAGRALATVARRAYADLRRQGVRVLDWDPARTPLETVLTREVGR